MNDELLNDDAPIRDNFNPASKCKTCTKILRDCHSEMTSHYISDGFIVIIDCSGYECYEGGK